MNFSKYNLLFLLFFLTGSAVSMQGDVHEFTITNHQKINIVWVTREIPYSVVDNGKGGFSISTSKTYDTIAQIFPGETKTIRAYLAGEGNWIKITADFPRFNSSHIIMGKHYPSSQEVFFDKKTFDEENKQEKLLETIKVRPSEKALILIVNSNGIINFSTEQASKL